MIRTIEVWKNNKVDAPVFTLINPTEKKIEDWKQLYRERDGYEYRERMIAKMPIAEQVTFNKWASTIKGNHFNI